MKSRSYTGFKVLFLFHDFGHFANISSMIQVLYEDSDFLIVNKPSGLIVHATVDKSRENLYDILKKDHPELAILHRLDKDTSGAMLFSKNPEINKDIQAIFDERTIEKTYIALVHGEWEGEKGMMEDFLKKEKVKNKEKMVKVLKGGQKAITYFEKREYKNGVSLMSFTLETGRMHQIRVQSALRNHPLMGDAFYGKPDKAERLFLHSHHLEFQFQGRLISVTAPLPEEFKRYF